MVIPKPATSLAVALCILLPWEVLADEPPLPEQPLPEQERPWAQGVSDEDQQTALELFEEGNSLLRDSGFVQAAEKYRAALTHWDHPGIRYNMALALLSLDQPIEVHQHLEAAMRYGAEPLDADKFKNALSLKAFIEQQLARVEIRCDAPEASVSMDGRVLFVGPGHYEGWVRPGTYSFIASKQGYSTTVVKRSLFQGKSEPISLKLYSPEELVRYRRRWPAWKPWAVIGAGAAVALGGGLFYTSAGRTYDEFDKQVQACGGCMATPHLLGIHDRGDTLQRVAISMYSVGGGVLATGAVLAYLNQPEAYHVRPEEAESTLELSVAPVISRDETGVVAAIRF